MSVSEADIAAPYSMPFVGEAELEVAIGAAEISPFFGDIPVGVALVFPSEGLVVPGLAFDRAAAELVRNQAVEPVNDYLMARMFGFRVGDQLEALDEYLSDNEKELIGFLTRLVLDKPDMARFMHAEVAATSFAQYKGLDPANGLLISTFEPCTGEGMCSDTIAQLGIKSVGYLLARRDLADLELLRPKPGTFESRLGTQHTDIDFNQISNPQARLDLMRTLKGVERNWKIQEWSDPGALTFSGNLVRTLL